jgi:hypothetical protein
VSINYDTKRAPHLQRRTVARRGAPTGAHARAQSGTDHALKTSAIQLLMDAEVKKRGIHFAQFTSMLRSNRINIDE